MTWLGNKTIHIYKDMKVIFMDGGVSDVEWSWQPPA
jgi:hypothetical protein